MDNDGIIEVKPDEEGLVEVTPDVFEMLEEHEKKAAKKAKEEKPLTYEEFCEAQIKKAHEENLENPDYDFRNFYQRGDVIWFVRVNKQKWYGKVMRQLKVRTVYPRMMVTILESGEACCIGYPEKDQIFMYKADAQNFFDSVDLVDEDKMVKKKAEGDDDEGTVQDESSESGVSEVSTETTEGEIPDGVQEQSDTSGQ